MNATGTRDDAPPEPSAALYRPPTSLPQLDPANPAPVLYGDSYVPIRWAAGAVQAIGLAALAPPAAPRGATGNEMAAADVPGQRMPHPEAAPPPTGSPWTGAVPAQDTGRFDTDTVAGAPVPGSAAPRGPQAQSDRWATAPPRPTDEAYPADDSRPYDPGAYAEPEPFVGSGPTGEDTGYWTPVPWTPDEDDTVGASETTVTTRLRPVAETVASRTQPRPRRTAAAAPVADDVPTEVIPRIEVDDSDARRRRRRASAVVIPMAVVGTAAVILAVQHGPHTGQTSGESVELEPLPMPAPTSPALPDGTVPSADSSGAPDGSRTSIAATTGTPDPHATSTTGHARTDAATQGATPHSSRHAPARATAPDSDASTSARSSTAPTTYPTVGPGSQGSAVRSVQNLLQRHGYYWLGPINGRYDEATEQSVRNFQADQGLPSTGVVNQATWAALLSGD